VDGIPVCSSIPAVTSAHIFLNSGGKSGASTIETDHEWDVARAAVMKKNKDTCGVSVEIDVDAMDRFRIRKRVCAISFTCVIADFMIVSDPCTR
jgi:hypothetical protein